MTHYTEGVLSLPHASGSLVDEAQFQQELRNHHLIGLWGIGPEQVPHEPQPKALPHLWRWRDLSRLAAESWRFVPVEQGPSQRVHGRVLSLVNPASKTFGTTDTLFAGIQSLLPGETLRAHRHTMQAVRFILAGHGASTTVDGKHLEMEPGDFLLTPGWMWHQHKNTSSSPVIWLDGLDLPLVSMLSATFFEFYPDGTLPPTRSNTDSAGFTVAGIQPAHIQTGQSGTTLLRYPWANTQQALETFAQENKSGAIEMDFVNPLTGGSVMPTASCGMIQIEPGANTTRRREVASTIIEVFKGRGHSIIGDEVFSWEAGDVLALPSWTWYEHQADASIDGPTILFAMSDRPTPQALGLYRIEQA